MRKGIEYRVLSFKGKILFICILLIGSVGLFELNWFWIYFFDVFEGRLSCVNMINKSIKG